MITFVGGIYKIQSIIKPERIYIGSCVDFGDRWRRHKNSLLKGNHKNPKLQRHYNKYGEEDLVYTKLIFCQREELAKDEQYFIDLFVPFFNNYKIAYSPSGRVVSQETRDKISKSLTGMKQSQETIDKRRNALKGRKKPPRSDEHKKNISNAKKGGTPWNKGVKGWKQSPEWISKKLESYKRTIERKKQVA